MIPPIAIRTETTVQDKTTALHQKAQQLEASFLSQMLSEAGVGSMPASFGGGSGEEQFASFLRDAYSEQMVKAGGIGLSEAIFKSLTKGQNE